MKIPKGDHWGYKAYHTLKPEFKEEMEMDLFLVCFDMDRTKDFESKGFCATDKMILKEKVPLISDDYLIALCNECLCYENFLALQILIEEAAKRNTDREDGKRILLYKENVK